MEQSELIVVIIPQQSSFDQLRLQRGVRIPLAQVPQQGREIGFSEIFCGPNRRKLFHVGGGVYLLCSQILNRFGVTTYALSSERLGR